MMAHLAWLFFVLQAQETPPQAGHSVHGEAFNEGPRQKASLLEGMGKVVFPITTSVPQAQRFFTQGVGQLHGFYYYEAERSFRQAALLDPKCAMACWGMAMANINNETRAKGFIKEAEKLKAGSGRRDTLWIDALSAYYKEGKGDKRGRAYIRALENIVHEFPDDLEAKAFLVWAIWHFSGKGLPINSHEAVDSIIAGILQKEPAHPGAHHYRIHLWDSEKSSRALSSAEAYGFASPGIAHAWHMPGHIWTKAQRYADAAWCQEAAARVDHAQLMRDRVMPWQIHNYAHNNQWLITTLSQVGRVRDGVALAENLIDIPRHPAQNKIEDSQSCARLGRSRLMELLVRWEMWDELVARGEKSLRPIATPEDQVRRLRALGSAHLARGDVAEGRRAIAELEGLVKTQKSANAAIAELNGRLATAQEDFKAALDHFAKADDLNKEVLARAQLRAGQKELAEKTARAAVDGAVNQVGPLASLVEILFRIDKAEEAASTLRRLREIARYADPDLPIFKRLKLIAKALNVSDEGNGVSAPPAASKGLNIETLGSLLWKPQAAPSWTRADADGKPFSLSCCNDEPVVFILYLGSGCSHCVEQLAKFSTLSEEYAAAGLRVVAMSTESADELLAGRGEKEPYSFPLLSDPGNDVFKQYRAFDDFENAPLHGTFLIDTEGKIRWQDIAFKPFMDPKFLLEECRRLLAPR